MISGSCWPTRASISGERRDFGRGPFHIPVNQFHTGSSFLILDYHGKVAVFSTTMGRSLYSRLPWEGRCILDYHGNLYSRLPWKVAVFSTTMGRSLYSRLPWEGRCILDYHGKVAVFSTTMGRSLYSRLPWEGRCILDYHGKVAVFSTTMGRSLCDIGSVPGTQFQGSRSTSVPSARVMRQPALMGSISLQ